MSYSDATRISGPLEQIPPPFGYGSAVTNDLENRNNQQRHFQAHHQEHTYAHGEALARDPWAERYGIWIILGFTVAFTFFLMGMNVLGQTPGKSFLLKSLSDILQFVGEGIGFIFCARIALRLRRVARYLQHDVAQKAMERHAPNELAKAHTDAILARRAYLAWLSLTIAIALYASGQAIWTSYDIRMSSANVPFPGLYDIGFVGSYPFFLAGTLLLTRRNKATVGRARLILDALAVIGASLALSWFFLLSPLIAGLAQAPSAGAAILSIYFPTGDLFLVAVGAFLMFSPLANRSQQSVFLLLCLGLFCLAITDSLLAYYSLSSNFNTGTLQDILWPLSMALVGLAAIEYPRSIAREQEQAARANNGFQAVSALFTPSRSSQFTATAQTIAPFILVLMTCTILLTIIAPRGGSILIQSDVVALTLILIVIARQALTLLENNRLTMQMRGELVISRRELQVTRREADEAAQAAQEKQILEDGVATLRAVHARVSRGDFAARAPTIAGPLLPIAVSLNLMLDRLSSMSQRVSRYEQLVHDCQQLQEAVERLGQGKPVLPANQAMPQSLTQLRSVLLGMVHVQRIQESQRRRISSAISSMTRLTHRLREALREIRYSRLFADSDQSGFERMALDRAIRELELLEQQQSNLLAQTTTTQTPYVTQPIESDRPTTQDNLPEQAEQQEPNRGIEHHQPVNRVFLIPGKVPQE